MKCVPSRLEAVNCKALKPALFYLYPSHVPVPTLTVKPTFTNLLQIATAESEPGAN